MNYKKLYLYYKINLDTISFNEVAIPLNFSVKAVISSIEDKVSSAAAALFFQTF